MSAVVCTADVAMKARASETIYDPANILFSTNARARDSGIMMVSGFNQPQYWPMLRTFIMLLSLATRASG